MNVKIVSVIFLVLLVLAMVAPLSFAECSVTKDHVMKSIIAYVTHEYEAVGISRGDVIALIKAYLDPDQCNDPAVNAAVNKASQIDDSVVPKCTDGTAFAGCSIDRPKYCYAGKLVDRCDLCCDTGECGSDGKCETSDAPYIRRAPPCSSYGDIDNNGYVTGEDGKLVANFVSYPGSTQYALTPSQKARAEVTADGVLNGGDAVAIENYAIGYLATFRVCSVKRSTCVSYGDLDDDGYVTYADRDLMILYSVGDVDFTDVQKSRADLDGNGQSGDAVDVNLIAQFVAGDIGTFPACRVSACVSYGDLDDDGYVTYADRDLMILYSVGDVDFTDVQKSRADLDGNGQSGDAVDVNLIVQFVAGDIGTFPACSNESPYGRQCNSDGDCSTPLLCKASGRYDGSDGGIAEKYCCGKDECASVMNGPCVGVGGTDVSDLNALRIVKRCELNSQTQNAEYVVDCAGTYGEGYWCATRYEWDLECNAVGDVKDLKYTLDKTCSFVPDTYNCVMCGSAETYTFSLHPGENMISFPVIPSGGAVEKIFGPIGGGGVVWAYDASDTVDHWKKYDPLSPFGNDLLTVSPGVGYILIMNRSADLVVSGDAVQLIDSEVEAKLAPGSNLVGAGSSNIYLSAKVGKWRYDVNSAYVESPILEVGKSYWVDCDSTESSCFDAVDNDCDKLIDKSDPDCGILLCHNHTDPVWLNDGNYKIKVLELGCEKPGCTDIGSMGAREALIEVMEGQYLGEQLWVWIDTYMSPMLPDIGSCYTSEIFTDMYATECGAVVRYLMNQVDCSEGTYTFSLHPGQNMISFPVIPSGGAVTEVFAPVEDSMLAVWAYDASDTVDHWKKYDPFAPFGNDLMTVSPGVGYILIMNRSADLVMSGSAVQLIDSEVESKLAPGSNLVGAGGSNVYLSAKVGKWRYDVNSTYVESPTLEVGKSYWVDCNLTESSCVDGIDNDCNGLVDLSDSNCGA